MEDKTLPEGFEIAVDCCLYCGHNEPKDLGERPYCKKHRIDISNFSKCSDYELGYQHEDCD